MSLDTYANLLVELAAWTRRSDLSAELPTFVVMAEAQLNRRLRCQRMISRSAAFSITSQITAAPADFLAPRSLRINSSSPPQTLSWVSDEQMDELLDTTDYTSGTPLHYTLEGGNFRFSPDPGATAYTASLSYYAKLPALAANGSNWLLASHPDAYLYGALLQSAPYLKADERVTLWAQLFEQIIADINASDTGMGGALQMQPSTSFAGNI